MKDLRTAQFSALLPFISAGVGNGTMMGQMVGVAQLVPAVKRDGLLCDGLSSGINLVMRDGVMRQL